VKVTVEFFGPLRGRIPRGRDFVEVDVTEGSTVGDLFRQLGLQEGEVFGASLDGHFVGREQRLMEGQRVFIFPPMAGG